MPTPFKLYANRPRYGKNPGNKPTTLVFVTGDGRDLGRVEVNTKEQPPHQFYWCQGCGKIVGRVYSLCISNVGALRKPWYSRPVVCADCGGSDTLMFQPFIYSVYMLDRTVIPSALLAYELHNAIETRYSTNKDN